MSHKYIGLGFWTPSNSKETRINLSDKSSDYLLLLGKKYCCLVNSLRLLISLQLRVHFGIT
jgi:hypothetical protein